MGSNNFIYHQYKAKEKNFQTAWTNDWHITFDTMCSKFEYRKFGNTHLNIPKAFT